MPGTKHHLVGDPPRRGAVIALTVDSTARAYDLQDLTLANVKPEAQLKRRHELVLWLQAETADVYFYFASGSVDTVVTTDVDDVSDTAAVSAGSALAFANTYCGVIPKGAPIPFAIDRSIDRFIVVKAASSSGILRIWAGSEST